LKTVIERVVFVTDRPLLAVGFREVLLGAGLDMQPGILEPARLVVSLPAGERWLIIVDGEGALDWGALDSARRRSPDSLFVVCCGATRPELLLAAMDHGLDGLISMRIPVAEASEALAQICRGERQFRFQDTLEQRRPDSPPLSPREKVVLAMVADGLRNRQIAVALGTSENNVKVHINRLLRKTGTKRRQELALLARPLLTDSPETSNLPAFDDGWMFGV
jgi:DNA-binding NarL/FixJ family response regulator